MSRPRPARADETPAVNGRWLAVGFVAGLLFLLMLGRTGVVPVPDADPPVFGLDKWLHFADYLVLGLLVGWALADRAPARTFRRATLGTAAYGVGLEALQLLLSYRTFELGDVGANLAGAALGAGLWSLLLLARSRSGDTR